MLSDFENSRMEKAKSNNGKLSRETNCIGTVLYVFGAIDEDRFIGDGEDGWSFGIVERFLSKLERISSPREGAILVIRGQEKIEHMGIVIASNPPMVYHRPGCNSPIEPAAHLENVLSGYDYGTGPEFYMSNFTED
jgi:hypothetical protein